MFDAFLNYFGENLYLSGCDDSYDAFINLLGGKRFGRGIFNSFSKEDLGKWNQIVTEAYPEFQSKFKIFGYDWLGRCFGIALNENTYRNILMFEIGTNDVLEIPITFQEFLNKEIPLYSEACLARSFFEDWMEYSKQELAYGRCAGYKVPLFLGGEDSVNNLEDSDMQVYWCLMTQIKSTIGK